MVRIASPTFVGRGAEQASLDEALDSAAGGNTTTVLIGGDAGVGKSRLLDNWNTGARGRGARISSGACLDLGESGPAYVALVQAFRDLIRPLAPSAVDSLVGTDRSTLALVIPELVVDTGPADKGQRSTPIAQVRLFDRLVRVLERASSNGPLVLELEDIHWADLSTRAFLQYLVANSRTAKLLIVATFRAEEAGREHPVTSMLRQVARHPSVRQIDLLPFDADELRQQLLGILGKAPSRRLLATIYARSEGNALFVEELIASGDPAVELPSSIGAALLARTVGLSSSALATLRVASVAGRTTPYDVLRSAIGFPNDRLDAALREVVGANILQPEHAGERYRFRHALLQEAIYQDTLPGERRRLHAAVAEALARDTADSLDDPEAASQLAYHWFEARDHDRALLASLASGDTAMRQAAYAEALHHYERVLEQWDAAPLARAGLRHVDILERASRSTFLAGDPHRSIEYARRALDELENTDDTILRVRLIDQIARASHWSIRQDEAVEYELRLGAIDPHGLPVREQLMVLESRVGALRWRGDPAATVTALEALRLADTIDDPELKADAHMTMAWSLFESRDFHAAIGEAQQAGEFASVCGDAETEVEALDLVYSAHLHAGQHEMAIKAARAARAYADEVGLAEWEGPSASVAESEALFELGRITESTQVIEAALLDPPANRANLSQYHLIAAQVSMIRGATSEAATHLEEARDPEATVEEENARGWLATARAELAISEGRLDDVRAIVDFAASAISRTSPFSVKGEAIWGLVEIGLDAEAARAEAVRAAGAEQAIGEVKTVARTLLGYVKEVRRRRDEAGVKDTGMGSAYEAVMEGHLARIEDRDDPGLWAVASEMFPPRSPRALAARYRQAEAMLAGGVSRAEIQAVMAEAHTAAVEIGARPIAGRFESLARRARIDLRPAAASPSAEVGFEADEPQTPGTVALRERGLSDREIEVLTLVSAGFSNHDIGARLYISDKTASVHVSHILRKLDAATRTEAATIGVRLGLPEVERDWRPA